MSVWLTEREFRQSGATATGITINVAFLQEIKEENIALRQLIDRVSQKFAGPAALPPLEILNLMYRVNDELETYFALEEFYGYFSQAKVTNPAVSVCAERLQSEHEQLFLRFNDIIELLEQIVYNETDASLQEALQLLNQFRAELELHEQCEMELMMRLCNEEFGVGD